MPGVEQSRKQLFIGQYTESCGMTTKRKTFSNRFIYKRKKKQIYKITFLNNCTGFAFICKRTSFLFVFYFTFSKAYYDKGQRRQGSCFTKMTSQARVQNRD